MVEEVEDLGIKYNTKVIRGRKERTPSMMLWHVDF